MAITCNLNEKEFDYIYGMTKTFIQNKIDNDQVFDISSYLDYLYERIKRAASKSPNPTERAATLLSQTPAIIEAVINRNFNKPEFDKYFMDLAKLAQLKRKFSQKDIEIANAIEYFEGANKVDVRNNKQYLKNTKKGILLKKEGKFDKDASPRLVSRTVMSGTLPAFKSVRRGKIRVEEPDIERIIINRNFETILNKLNLTNSDLSQFTYQGVPVRLTAVNLNDFTRLDDDVTRANLKKLDSTSQQEIATSRTLQRQGKTRSDVTQVNNRAIMILTDVDGNALSFDNEANIVDAADADGKFVFQFMRDIKKDKNGNFEIKDIYGIEDRIATPEVIATERLSVDKSKTADEHLLDVLSEMEQYFDIRNRALKEPVTLDLVGMTPGVSANLKTKDIKLSTLLDNKVVTRANVKAIEPLDTKFEGFESGTTIVKIAGNFYMLDRNRMSNDVADQIAGVLFNSNVDLDTKKRFYSQFIPEKNALLAPSMRRHRIIEFDDHMVVQIFSRVGKKNVKRGESGWATKNGVTENLVREILIDNTGEIYLKTGQVTNQGDYLSGYTKQEGNTVETLKGDLLDAFNKAYYDFNTGEGKGSTFIAYDRDLIKKPRNFDVYDPKTGKFSKGDYIDFILRNDSFVKIQPTQDDFYNKQIIFKEATVTSDNLKVDVQPDIILGPEGTPSETEFNEELSKKIETILREKYPEIKLSFTNDPITFDSDPDVFNQEMTDFQRATKLAIAELTKPLRDAQDQFYKLSRKNRIAFLATIENAIKDNPYEYISVSRGGKVIIDTEALGGVLLDTYGEDILDWSSQQEIKKLNEAEASGMDPNNPDYAEAIKKAEQADDDLQYLADLEIKKIKDTISGFDNGTKTKEDLFNIFVTTENYFGIAQSMNAYLAKRFPGVRRDFNLKGKEGIYTYYYVGGKLDTVYEKIPGKRQERAGKDPVTGEKLYRAVQYYTSEEVTPSDDRWIDAQLALKEFKDNTERVKKAINITTLENLEKETLKQRFKVQYQTPEQRKADLASGAIEDFAQHWEHYYGPAPGDILDGTISVLVQDILDSNGITDGARGLVSPTYFHNSNDLLERTRNAQYEKLKAKQDLVKYVLNNKDEFSSDDRDISGEAAGGVEAPVPGWFINAVSAEQSGKLFKDLRNNIAETVIALSATEQWDELQDQGYRGYETPFQRLAALTDFNSRLTDKLVYGSTNDVFSDLYLLNQTYKNKIIGQANIKAMTVLIDALNQKQDTLPHEYAHHYIAYFRDTKIVQEGIKRFGGEEALVQAIGEQVVAQKGEALNWWKKFTKWLLNLLSDKQVLQVLTDSFLNKTNLRTDFIYDTVTGAPTSSDTINIFAGTKENADLSNFAKRPFETPVEDSYREDIMQPLGKFDTVEGAFQAQKLARTYNPEYQPEVTDVKLFQEYKEKNALLQKLRTATGAEAKAIGRKIKGLNVGFWDAESSAVMKALMKASFQQNPKALKRLLDTGDAILTHKFKGKEQDKGRFSRLLMEIRQELKDEESFVPDNILPLPSDTEITPEENKKQVDEDNDLDTDQSDYGDLFDDLERSGKVEADEVTKADIDKALDFWNNSETGKLLSKHISLKKAVNLVNSDAYAKFVVSGATLANPDIMGSILINKAKGSAVDIYHESFHAFTQLFLSPADKKALYNEVLDFKDKDGNQPYKNMSAREIEEMLAEDFRTYMKKSYVKKGSPKRNSIFRRLLNFIKALFGKLKSVVVKDVKMDIMSVPAVNELFVGLKSGNPKFLNKYKAKVSNAQFLELNRGITALEKVGRENKKRSVLNKQDSDLVVESIDSAISEIIDRIYQSRVNGKQQVSPNFKAISLAALLEPKYRQRVYDDVKLQFEQQLEKTSKKFQKSIGGNTLTDIIKSEDPFETLKDSVAGVLYADTYKKGNKKGKKKTTDKYVLLESQIDSFDNLIPNTKSGQRTAGSTYWGIKMVGNFYTVPGLLDSDGRPVEVIVVSNPEDVALQYENYIKAGSTAYGSFQNFTDRAPVLNDEQTVLFNQIRILSSALKNWGTLGDIQKGVAPTGTIAYHIRHSDFEIGKAKYFVADEVDPALANNEDVADTEDPIDLKTDTEVDDGSVESPGMNPDILDGKRSLLQLADKEVVYMLKSLHQVESIDKKGNITYAKNRLGFRQRADFRKTWNIVSKTIAGIQDRKLAYRLLVRESKSYPVLKQLMDNKLPSPELLTNDVAFTMNAAFWHTFAKPSAIYKQFTIQQDIEVEGGYRFRIEDSSPAINSTILKFSADFKSATSPYVSINEEQAALLDTVKLVKGVGRNNIKQGKEREFLKALGINIDKTEKLNFELTSDESSEPLRILAQFVTKIADLKSKKEGLTTAEQNIILKFEADPPTFFRDKDRYMKEFKEAGLYDKASQVRVDSSLKYFAGLQSKYGFDTPGEMIKLPDGNMASTITNHMTITSMLDGINSLDTLEQAWTMLGKKGYLGHLDPTKNFFTNRSKTLDSLFAAEDADGSRKRIEGNAIDFIAFAGSEIIFSAESSDGKTTADLTAADKFFQNLHYMLLAGIVEGSRAAEKNSAFGIAPQEKTKVLLPNGTSAGTDNKLWIDTDKFIPTEFSDSVGENIAIEGFLLDYIGVEFDRIQFFYRNPEVLKTTKGFNKKKTNDVLAGLEFAYLEDMLSDSTKKELYKLAKDKKFDQDIKDYILGNADLLAAVKKDLIEYFDAQIDDLYERYLVKTPFQLNRKLFGDETSMTEEEYLSRARGVLSAYYYNSWISRFEQNNLIVGDISQLDHSKEAGTKRLPGPQSNGTGFLIDEDAQYFVNESFNKETYAAKFKDEGIETLTTDGSINVGIVNDPERISLYIKEQEESWRESYAEDGLSEKEIEERIKEDSKPYFELEEADGHAVMTLDSYRMLKKLGGPQEWTQEQENLYQDIINDRPVDPKKAIRTFPVYKLQYFGPIMNAKINTTMMLKFAVTPISPSWAKEGTEAYKLHKKMMKENMPMIAFSSSSKVASLSFTEGEVFDNIFDESKPSEYSKVNADASIAPNELHLKYWKDVTKVSSKLKGENTLGTQDRVITLDTLYDKGEVMEGIDPKLAADYLKATSNLSAVYKAELLERIGYEYVVDEKGNGKYVGNIKRLVSVLRNELEMKEIPAQILDMLDVRLNDQLSYDFSVIPVADVIEKTLVNLISKSLIKQKTNGESLVNVPVTLFGGVWEPTWPSEEARQEAIDGNEETIRKYLGTNGLPSYRRGEVIDEKTGKRKPTYLAKAAIAFTGQWLNLLNIRYQGKLIRINNADGSIDMNASLANLNRLIKTDAFIKEHGDKIRIAGPRIPTDAINLKEAFEVWHFLPADSAVQVIVPTEIVAKAGSDFDLDKIFFSFPNIDSNGQLPKEVKNFKETIARLKAEGKSTRGIIMQQKRYAQNEWLRTNINIIRDPKNYAALTKPTSDYLVRNYIEKHYVNRKGVYNPAKSNVHVKDERITGTRLGEERNDLEKHSELLGGNKPLGIGAKVVKQHALYKSIGAKFPKSYTQSNASGPIQRDFVLNFDHQKTADGNISLSHAKNVDNVKISGIYSHDLQGILDRANDSFISKANIVEQTLPFLNRLIGTGVSFPVALDFINQPLIVEYVEGKIESSGFISGSLNPITDSDILRAMGSRLNQNSLQILDDALKYSNDKRMNEVMDSLSKSKFKGKILIEHMGKRKKFNSYADFVKEFNGVPGEISTFSIKPEGAKNYRTAFKKDWLNFEKPSLQSLRSSNYYVSEYLWKKYFKGNATLNQLRSNIEEFDSGDITDQETYDGQQLAALAHYFQVLDQSSGMEQLEIFFNPDTTLVDTLVSVQNRKAFIEKLEMNSKVDDATLNALLKTSVISSLYDSDIFLQLVPGLMELRTMPQIISYISDSLESDKQLIKDRFGKRVQDKDRYIAMFNNGIVDYIYQNVMSNFVNQNSLPIQLPSSIKKQSGEYTVKKFTGTLAKPISIDGFTLNVDLTKLRKIYKGKFFLSNIKGKYAFTELKKDSFKPNQNPFQTFDSFVRYAIEKEILYNTYSQEDFISAKKYETFISERALLNTNNRAYIMGTTKYSYTGKVLSIIKKYPYLSFKYPVLLQLSESFQGKRVKEGGSTGLSLLELKDKKIITPEQAAEYAKNLMELGDISVQKSNNTDREKAAEINKEISDTFANFSLLMYYQQGVGRSSLSFSKALNGVAFTEIMTNAANSFMDVVSKPGAQTGLIKMLDSIKDSLLLGTGYKNYLKNADNFLKVEDLDLTNQDSLEQINELDRLKDQLEIAKLDQDVDSIKSLIEAIKDLQSKIDAEKAQQDFPVAPGVEIISRDYGVTKVDTNPVESTTVNFVQLLQPQILAQLYKENKGVFANAMLNYGYRWTRATGRFDPVLINSYATKTPGETEYYGYDRKDQNGNDLPPISTLDPIMKVIEDNLGMDMSGYDSAIVNIYEGKEHIYPHKDTSEDITAEGYPVVVYSMGNDSSLGVWDDNQGKMTFAYKYRTPDSGPYKGMDPTNEVQTQNGSIYTFGMNGNGRFALTHTTPTNASRDKDYPPITLPDGRVITKYTITVTFRRAAPLTPGMPVKPGMKIVSDKPLSESDAVAVYPQNLVSGIESFGTKQFANAAAVKLLGPNATSIDMIGAGIRTRTTRSAAKAGDIKVGDIILHVGNSADGQTKKLFAKVTAIHPKGSEGWKSTWSKEGWTEEGFEYIERYNDGALAIEFELLGKPMTAAEAAALKNITDAKEVKEQPRYRADQFVNHAGGAYGADTFMDVIGREFGVLNHNHYKSPADAKVSATLKKNGVEPVVLTDKQMDEAYRALDKLTGKTNTRNNINDLKARNYFQVKNADAVYALAYLNGNRTQVKGGTSYAVRFAQRMKKPIYVWDIDTENWYEWNGKSFESTETPRLTKNFAGVGSRDLENYKIKKDGKWVDRSTYVGDAKSLAAQKAIRDLYENSIGEPVEESYPVEVGRFVDYKGKVYIALKSTSQGWQIYNPTISGASGKLNVSLQNLTARKEKADLVIDTKTNRSYLVTPDKTIISLLSGKVMMWTKNNGDRLRILSLAEQDIDESSDELKADQTLSGLTFNEGQSNAIEKILNFLKSDEQIFVLEGKAGTGKTTLLKEILLNYQKENGDKTILIGALSWQATNVLASVLSNKPKLKFEKNSIAGMLDRKLDEITGQLTPVKYETGGGKVGSADLIVIDEASMINEEQYDGIIEALIDPKKKIIFLGDRGQLPPIRKVTSNDNSPVFDIVNKAELTERVRQGEESPILPYADLYWDNADNETPVSDPAEGNRRSVVQQEGQLVFTDAETAVDVAIQEYKEAIEKNDYNLVKVVTYHNARRFKVNKEVHLSVFGEDAHFYTPKTPIVFNGPYDGKVGKFGDKISFINSDQAVVEEILEQGQDEYLINYVVLKIKTPRTDKPVIITAVDFTKEALADNMFDTKYGKKLKVLRDRYFAIKNTRGSSMAKVVQARNKYVDYLNRYANISQSYAITSHKSQGSTYNTVIVDEVDIYSNKRMSAKNKSNSMYTAITRAKNNVIIVSNKTTPYQGKITLLKDSEIQVNKSTGINSKLAKFYESLTPAQLDKLGNVTLESLQERFNDLSRYDLSNTFTIEEYIDDLTDKCN